MIARLEAEIADWESELKEHPNPLLDPHIINIIHDMKEMISDLQEED